MPPTADGGRQTTDDSPEGRKQKAVRTAKFVNSQFVITLRRIKTNGNPGENINYAKG